MGFTSESQNPPIREPNMPQNDDKNDKKEEKKNDKPVVKTEGEILRENKNLNLTDKSEVVGYKNEWGVKLPDDSIKPDINDDNLSNFIFKRKWGVNLLNPIVPEEMKNKVIKVPSFRRKKSPDLTSMLEQQFVDSLKNDEKIEAKSESPPPIIDSMNISSVVSPIEKIEDEEDERKVDVLRILNENKMNAIEKNFKLPSAIKSATELKRQNFINQDDDYYIPKDIIKLDEISAWQDVVKRTKIHKEEILEAEKNKIIEENKPEIFSIPPEPPNKMKDFAVVRSLDTRVHQIVDSGHFITHEISPIVDARKFIYHIDSKKFHTLSFMFFCVTIQENNPSQIHRENNLPLQLFGVTKESVENSRITRNHAQISESFNQNLDIMRLESDEKSSEDKKIPDENKKNDDNDGDFVHAPGDPYPFNRENYEKWRLPHGSDPLNRQPTD